MGFQFPFPHGLPVPNLEMADPSWLQLWTLDFHQNSIRSLSNETSKPWLMIGWQKWISTSDKCILMPVVPWICCKQFCSQETLPMLLVKGNSKSRACRQWQHYHPQTGDFLSRKHAGTVRAQRNAATQVEKQQRWILALLQSSHPPHSIIFPFHTSLNKLLPPPKVC